MIMEEQDKMKNKGFTLVELLAVIAILAILVIIALPNVLKMYNQSKKNIFLTRKEFISFLFYFFCIGKFFQEPAAL